MAILLSKESFHSKGGFDFKRQPDQEVGIFPTDLIVFAVRFCKRWIYLFTDLICRPFLFAISKTGYCFLYSICSLQQRITKGITDELLYHTTRTVPGGATYYNDPLALNMQMKYD